MGGGGGGQSALWAADRVLLVDRRAAAALLPGHEAWRPNPGARVLAGDRGKSCDDRCRREGRRCDARELEFVNSCEALARVFPCEGGCGHQIGNEIPAYVPDRAADTFGQCLVTEQRMPQCGATHRSTARVCACV